jgi:hypothetical protein
MRDDVLEIALDDAAASKFGTDSLVIELPLDVPATLRKDLTQCARANRA